MYKYILLFLVLVLTPVYKCQEEKLNRKMLARFPTTRPTYPSYPTRPTYPSYPSTPSYPKTPSYGSGGKVVSDTVSDCHDNDPTTPCDSSSAISILKSTLSFYSIPMIALTLIYTLF